MLFKKKKKIKEEIISIDVSQEEVTEEKVEEEKEEKKNVDLSCILKKQNDVKHAFPNIYREYYLAKIFSRVGLDDEEYNILVIEIDKYVRELDDLMKDINRSITLYTQCGNDDIEELYRIDDKLDKLTINQRIINQRLKDINVIYYGQLKMPTVSVCLNMRNEELEAFYISLNDYIVNRKSFNKAAEEIYYSSGDFIMGLVNYIIECIKLTANSNLINKYNFRYFLDTDIVITLDESEWISLYTKICSAFSVLSSIEKDRYLKLEEKCYQFKIMYVILMMQFDSKNLKEKDKRRI